MALSSRVGNDWLVSRDAAEAIRRLADRGLSDDEVDRAQLYERAASAVGRFRDRSGARDVAKAHDRYLDEAFE